ncbi:MAG: hypothetical protein A6F70_01930 [Cycloclasticus sp. symbiont of Bathymodiolus heckerae]|nr:MAG: hypothetical protein A6F70_01930 [Cycloclasticus sp. symbiont of Bathymodiolus heckerae]
MANLNQNNTHTPASLRLGFRPFFFIAGLSGAILMLLWLFVHQGMLSIENTTPMDWHAHEMIFGYSAAVIIGFLLTASKNWSGRTNTVRQAIVGASAGLGCRPIPYCGGCAIPWLPCDY